MDNILEIVKFNKDGLIPVIAQDINGSVLMLAWMNKESLSKSIDEKKLYYYSRSRKKLWLKGESSGQTQELISFALDCDSDSILATVKQKGVACHTGRPSCFYKHYNLVNNKYTEDEIVINPDDLYS